MSGRILVGTSSWTDKSLLGSGKFYPREVKTPEARLRYYAERFPVVQNDAAWYALPARKVVEDWVQRTPAGFVFDVKLFRLFTRHQTPLMALPPDIRAAVPQGKPNVYFEDVPDEVRDEIWARYADAISPLAESGKLGVVMVQLAPWIGPSKEARDHLRYIREKLAGWPLAVEFRNVAWYGEREQRTFDLLREIQMAHVIPDAPRGQPFAVPLVPVVTWPRVSILRMHGRNAETWAKKGLKSSADRFNYEYRREELSDLVPTVRGLAGEAESVHVMFNVNYQDQGQRAARSMMELLGLAPPDQP